MYISESSPWSILDDVLKSCENGRLGRVESSGCIFLSLSLHQVTTSGCYLTPGAEQ